MSRGKGGEIRRNDGFRIADARQVRIEALEKTVQRLRRELDTARLDVERAQREVRAMCAAMETMRQTNERVLRDQEDAWKAVADAPKYTADCHFGSSQSETRPISGDGWIGEESRRVDRDEAGHVTFVGPWHETGGRLYPNGMPKSAAPRWWDRLFGAKA